MSQSSLSRLQVLGAALIFSTGGVAIKATTLSGLELAGARSAVAALVLFWLLPGWRRFWRPRALLVGACYASTLVCFVVATKNTMAANAIFLQSTAPITVLLLAPWLLGEPNRRSDYGVTALLMVGVSLFFVEVDAASATAPDPAFGNAVAIASGVSMAFGLMGLRWLALRAPVEAEDESGAAALAGNVLTAALCLPFAASLGAAEPTDVALVVYLGAVQIGLGYWVLTRGLRALPAVEVSGLLLAEPLFNAIWAGLLLAERPGPWSLAGCGVIALAMGARVGLQRQGAA